MTSGLGTTVPDHMHAPPLPFDTSSPTPDAPHSDNCLARTLANRQTCWFCRLFNPQTGAGSLVDTHSLCSPADSLISSAVPHAVSSSAALVSIISLIGLPRKAYYVGRRPTRTADLVYRRPSLDRLPHHLHHGRHESQSRRKTRTYSYLTIVQPHGSGKSYDVPTQESEYIARSWNSSGAGCKTIE